MDKQLIEELNDALAVLWKAAHKTMTREMKRKVSVIYNKQKELRRALSCKRQRIGSVKNPPRK